MMGKFLIVKFLFLGLAQISGGFGADQSLMVSPPDRQR